MCFAILWSQVQWNRIPIRRWLLETRNCPFSILSSCLAAANMQMKIAVIYGDWVVVGLLLPIHSLLCYTVVVPRWVYVLSLPLIHYSWAREGIYALYPEMLSIFPSKTVIGSVQSMAPCLGWWSQCALFGYCNHNCCCVLFKSGDRCTLRNLIGIALFECCIAFLRSAWGRRSHAK